MSSVKLPLDGPSSCTRERSTLGNSLLARRRTRRRAHQWSVEVDGIIWWEVGGVELELQKWGQKHHEVEGPIWARWIDKWWGETLVNRRWAAAAGELIGSKKWRRKRGSCSFYSWRQGGPCEVGCRLSRPPVVSWLGRDGAVPHVAWCL
jgi:hypothetical protein